MGLGIFFLIGRTKAFSHELGKTEFHREKLEMKRTGRISERHIFNDLIGIPPNPKELFRDFIIEEIRSLGDMYKK